MKKFTKIISLMLAIMMIAVLFVGCGGGKEGGSIVGKWSYEEEGAKMIMEFTADGKLKMSVIAEEIGEMELGGGTYEIKGDSIFVTVDGADEAEESKFSVKGNKLTIIDDSEELVLTKE